MSGPATSHPAATGIGPIGFVGLGVMGAEMVRRLIGHGHVLHVHDIAPAAVAAAVRLGATAHDSPAAVADAAPTVLVSLPTPEVVRQVALGPGGLIEGGRLATYVDLSTTGAVVASAVAEGLAARGVVSLDAPVSGGVAGAAAGTLAVMAAGDPAAFERLRPVLEVIGSRTTYVGGQVGQGQTLKLVNNLLCATAWAAACEALVMGARAGIDPALMTRVINESSGRSFSTERFVPGAVLERRFDFGFRLALMRKDMRLALEEAAALGVSMSTSQAARQLYDAALAQEERAQEGPAPDVTALIRLLEERGGAEVRAMG
ncbi:NAD(P)-dependent oxidoreductase [Roseomonas sp. NAR14]|uniref:NAD(P)-dependent oxidoreductase n=1 Tax=Roseomonas acroporae TaxID=2937791 RepID=A0A9X2BTS9_9PROT|nr:NAD(P)-dependent oxidoreductase [Roseomonas acroporae]MCK8784647.1 NAD(P)-dependent oxidoreductase [Roseomonas acroporae]